MAFSGCSLTSVSSAVLNPHNETPLAILCRDPPDLFIFIRRGFQKSRSLRQAYNSSQQTIKTMSGQNNYTCVEHTVPCTHIRQYSRATSTHQGEVLHLAVKQYKPLSEPQDGDVTILACHASAFPKELYEPIWNRMLENARHNRPGRRIRSIFIADVSNQGQSGILNEQKLGNERKVFRHIKWPGTKVKQLHTTTMLEIILIWSIIFATR